MYWTIDTRGGTLPRVKEIVGETLQQLVQRRLQELDISQREAARRAKGMISIESIAGIARGRFTARFKDKTLAGLSVALQTPESVIRRAARAPQAVGPWQPHTKFTRLSLEHRELVESFASALLALYPQEEPDGSR